jgi:tetratricopeptide (TPR) repeat protein
MSSNRRVPEPKSASFQPPESDDALIVPATVTISAREAPGEETIPGHKRWLFGVGLWAGLVVLIGLVAWVVFVLPDRIPQPPSGADQDQSIAPVLAARGPERSPFAEAQLAKQREAAQTVLEDLLEAQETVETKAVDRWAPEDYEKALEVANLGDAAYQRREFEEAQARYREATELFKQLVAKAEATLKQALAGGEAALGAGDAAAAITAFDMALSIAAENEQARTGRRRADTLDEVYPLLKRGDGLLAAGSLEQALAVFEQAAKIDPIGAQRGLGETRARIADRDFRAAMADAAGAQNAGQLERALEHFERALRIKPGAREAEEARNRISATLKENRSKALLADVERLEAEEKWQEAEQTYGALLAVDPNNTQARDKQKNAKERAELDSGIQAVLAHPENIADDTFYANAQRLLKYAKDVDAKGPKLNDQIARLDALVGKARTPVAVVLKSDKQTNVTIYKVGNLGTFDTHELSLLPGKYQAVGIRDGYRDVRVDFTVGVNQVKEPIVIQCTEPV